MHSLAEVADAEKLIDAADKAPPPSPGALPLHLTGSRARKGSDIALLQYTSGSTGDPKGVVLTHANLLANIRAIGEAVELGPGDVGVSWLPLYHDMGLIGAWLTLAALRSAAGGDVAAGVSHAAGALAESVSKIWRNDFRGAEFCV